MGWRYVKDADYDGDDHIASQQIALRDLLLKPADYLHPKEGLCTSLNSDRPIARTRLVSTLELYRVKNWFQTLFRI